MYRTSIRISNDLSVISPAVSTRPTRPALRERYDRRRAEVVLDAAHVFAGRGYDQTSVPELAEALSGLVAGGTAVVVAVCAGAQMAGGRIEDPDGAAGRGVAADLHVAAQNLRHRTGARDP